MAYNKKTGVKVGDHPFLADKPNKEDKSKVEKGTVKVTNIITQPVTHYNGIIKVGGSAKVTPYEAELYRRKKLVK